MAIGSPLELKELIPRLQDVLFSMKAACDAAPTAENLASLAKMEDLIEDLMDLDEVTESLEDTQRDGLVSWEEIKARHGL